MQIIEDYSQLLDWAERANRCVTTKERVLLQDEFGRSEYLRMKELFLSATEKDTRRLILFGVYKIMGDQWLDTYIDIWTQAKAEKYRSRVLDDLAKQYTALDNKQQAFNEYKRPIYKKIRKLMTDLKYQKLENEHLRTMLFGRGELIVKMRRENDELQQQITHNQCYADNWERLCQQVVQTAKIRGFV